MPSRWDAYERHVIHIASSEYGLSWKQIELVFEEIFKVDWKGTARPKANHIRNEYKGRRAKMWAEEIIKHHYTPEEEISRQQARDTIRGAARRLNISLTPKTASGPADSGQAAPVLQLQPPAIVVTPAADIEAPDPALLISGLNAPQVHHSASTASTQNIRTYQPFPNPQAQSFNPAVAIIAADAPPTAEEEKDWDDFLNRLESGTSAHRQAPGGPPAATLAASGAVNCTQSGLHDAIEIRAQHPSYGFETDDMIDPSLQ